jgi:hypothetical protein
LVVAFKTTFEIKIAIEENATAASINTIIEAGPMVSVFQKLQLIAVIMYAAVKLIKQLMVKPCFNH